MDMPLDDVNALDEVVHELGIEDSHVTPAEAVRSLKNDLEAVRRVLAALLNTIPDERQNPAIWFARIDAARAVLASKEG
jgi:hypothetical protein